MDLNPIRAGVAETPETSPFTSAYERIRARTESAAVTQASGSEVPRATEPSSPRDAWLSPLELQGEVRPEPRASARRASDKGFLPLNLEQYLSLLDWTGRQARTDKRGQIPGELLPILERLQLSSETWLETVKNFGRWFHRAVGRADSLTAEAARRGRQWLQGVRPSRTAFA